MANSGYYDNYQGLEAQNNLLHAIHGFRGTANHSNYEANADSKGGLGFYQEHFNDALRGAEGVQSSQSNPSSMPTMVTSADFTSGGMSVPATPSTPLTEESDSKSNILSPLHQITDIHGNAMMHPSMSPIDPALAKPVPMRRLSEKSVAHARASLQTGMTSGDSLLNSYSSYHKALGQTIQPEPNQTSSIARAIALSQSSSRRPRSEKKPIPDDLKDEKYFERRKRNNSAAKKSRDARKAREDEIAIRASFLEKENAILRAQVATLREEANSLRHLLLQKRSRQGP